MGAASTFLKSGCKIENFHPHDQTEQSKNLVVVVKSTNLNQSEYWGNRMSNSISEAFKKLNVTNDADLGDHEKIYTISYEYLSKVKHFKDSKAFKNCLVSLINMDKYDKAEKLVGKVPQSLVEELILEIAYIYYKLGQSAKVIELYNQYKNVEGVQFGLKHIVAQNYYKIGQYQNSLDLYSNIIENNKYDNKNDLVINERAVISQINFNLNNNLVSKHQELSDNYDLLFNEALIELSNQNLTKSLVHLTKAEELCQQQNLSPLDLLIELLPIKLTQAYIYQIQGDVEKSLAILLEQDVANVDDEMLKLIIKNNSYTMQLPQDSNINLLERDLNYQQSINRLSPRLTKFQYQIILKNNIHLKFNTGTIKNIDNSFIKQYLIDFPGDYFPVVYQILLKLEINFTDLTDPSQYKTISRKLIKTLNQKQLENEYNTIALLLLVFINSKQNVFDQSLPLLKQQVANDLQQEKLIPGLVGTLINIYEKLNKLADYQQLSSQLIEKFLNTNVDIISQDLNYYNFIKMVCFKCYNVDNEEEKLNGDIKKVLSILIDINPQDDLVSAFINNQPGNLLPIDQANANIDELLQTNIETLLPAKKVQKPIVHKIKKQKKANPVFSKNKVLVPKEELQLDDERWLPLKLRSYYKPTKKDKKKTGGHQGAFESTPTPVAAPTTTNTSLSSKSKKKKKGKK